MLFATSLFPIVIYLIVLKLLDGFKMVRWKMFVSCLLLGMLSCGVAAIMTWHMDAGMWVPVIEELLKGAIVLMLIARKKIVFFVEALVYGAATGGGFALLENTIYLHSYPDMLFGTALFRGFSTALLHIGCTTLTASLCLYIKHAIQYKPDNLYAWLRTTLFVAGLALPFGIHYIYNMHLLPSMVQMLTTIVVFTIIFHAISSYNENRIYKWLDHSISYDVQLLAAMRQGQLAETNTGRYLISIRSQFDAEVFFDMLCFMQLYLELVVAGKSRMLLEQEGLAKPLTDSERQLHKEKLTELHTLRRNIGKMGEYVLRPIISLNDTDLRVI